MRKYRFLIGGIIVLLLIFYLINSDVNDTMSQIDISEKNFDKDDSLILKKEMLNKIKVETVIKSKKRNVLKFYKYDNKYNFYATKIDLKNEFPLDEIISFNNESTSQDVIVSNWQLQSNKYYDVQFREENSSPVSKTIFSLSGDKKQLKKIVHNKDFISYSMPLTTLSLQYENKNNPTDVFVEASGSNLFVKKKVPFVVSFFKKEKSIYLLLMTPIEKETKMSHNILEEIIKF
jgi:hypothetical protein